MKDVSTEVVKTSEGVYVGIYLSKIFIGFIRRYTGNDARWIAERTYPLGARGKAIAYNIELGSYSSRAEATDAMVADARSLVDAALAARNSHASQMPGV